MIEQFFDWLDRLGEHEKGIKTFLAILAAISGGVVFIVVRAFGKKNKQSAAQVAVHVHTAGSVSANAELIRESDFSNGDFPAGLAISSFTPEKSLTLHSFDFEGRDVRNSSFPKKWNGLDLSEYILEQPIARNPVVRICLFFVYFLSFELFMFVFLSVFNFGLRIFKYEELILDQYLINFLWILIFSAFIAMPARVSLYFSAKEYLNREIFLVLWAPLPLLVSFKPPQVELNVESKGKVERVTLRVSNVCLFQGFNLSAVQKKKLQDFASWIPSQYSLNSSQNSTEQGPIGPTNN